MNHWACWPAINWLWLIQVPGAGTTVSYRTASAPAAAVSVGVKTTGSGP